MVLLNNCFKGVHGTAFLDPLGASRLTLRPYPYEEVSRDEERSISVTFSKGTLYQWRNFENVLSVDAIYMQELRPNMQPLYARVVFRSLSIGI